MESRLWLCEKYCKYTIIRCAVFSKHYIDKIVDIFTPICCTKIFHFFDIKNFAFLHRNVLHFLHKIFYFLHRFLNQKCCFLHQILKFRKQFLKKKNWCKKPKKKWCKKICCKKFDVKKFGVKQCGVKNWCKKGRPFLKPGILIICN